MINERVTFKNMVSSHLDRLLAASNKHRSFVTQFLNEDKLEYLSQYVEPKIKMTISDGKEHSTQIVMPPICYDLCTLAIPMDEAAKYYEQNYGGFGKLCARFMTEHPAFTKNGCEILIVIVYGRYDTKCWANLAVIAPKTSDWPDATVIPTDLLTESERIQTNL